MARSVRMNGDEAWAVLENAHTGVLTSLRADGWPISLPVWFVALDRRIYVAGPAHTKKFARIRNDPRVSFVVESGTQWAELVGVQLTGRAGVRRRRRATRPGHGRARREVRALSHAALGDALGDPSPTTKPEP